jgi:hypothetical protein
MWPWSVFLRSFNLIAARVRAIVNRTELVEESDKGTIERIFDGLVDEHVSQLSINIVQWDDVYLQLDAECYLDVDGIRFPRILISLRNVVREKYDSGGQITREKLLGIRSDNNDIKKSSDYTDQETEEEELDSDTWWMDPSSGWSRSAKMQLLQCH